MKSLLRSSRSPPLLCVEGGKAAEEKPSSSDSTGLYSSSLDFLGVGVDGVLKEESLCSKVRFCGVTKLESGTINVDGCGGA
jgi:hypothetical protein